MTPKKKCKGEKGDWRKRRDHYNSEEGRNNGNKKQFKSQTKRRMESTKNDKLTSEEPHEKKNPLS